MSISYSINDDTDGDEVPAATHDVREIDAVVNDDANEIGDHENDTTFDSAIFMVDKLFFSSHFVNYHAICPYCGAYASTFVRFNWQKACLIFSKVFSLQNINLRPFMSRLISKTV